MIKHAWAVDAADSSIKAREWAGVRPSTAAERRLVSAGRRDICCTFAFRQCQRVLRLVVSQEGVKQPFFSTKRKFEKAVWRLTEAHGLDAPEPYSASVLASAAVLVPGILSDVHSLGDSAACGDCTCIMKDRGMLDEGSATEIFVLDQLITTCQGLEPHQ